MSLSYPICAAVAAIVVAEAIADGYVAAKDTFSTALTDSTAVVSIRIESSLCATDHAVAFLLVALESICVNSTL